MEYALLGALGLGLLLFVISWLVVVVKGFQRHPITGIFALIPGLNIVTLPSLWYRVSGWVITGFVGFVLTLGAWFGGAQNVLNQQLQHFGLAVATPAAPPANVPNTPAPAATTAVAPTPVTTTALPLPPANATPNPAANQPAPTPVATQPAPASTAAAPNVATVVPDHELPKSALYHIVFTALPVDKLGENVHNYVRITQKDGHVREGKLLAATDVELQLEERDDKGVSNPQSIKRSAIRDAAIMTKREQP